MKSRKFSLKYKLLALLTIVPTLGLSVFLFLALGVFENDKAAYVSESSLNFAKDRAARVRGEIALAVAHAQSLVLNYQADTKNIAETGTTYFQREPRLEAFQIFVVDPGTGNYEKTVDLAKDNGRKMLDSEGAKSDSGLAKLLDDSREKNVTITELAGVPGYLVVAVRFGEVSDPAHVLTVSIFEAAELTQAFAVTEGVSTNYLLVKDADQALFNIAELEEGFGPQALWKNLAEEKAPEGFSEVTTPSYRPYLAAYTDVGVGDLVVINVTDRALLTASAAVFFEKALWCLGIMISLMTVIALIGTKRILDVLRGLNYSAKQAGQGNFGVVIKPKTRDEVSELAENFNAMLAELAALWGKRVDAGIIAPAETVVVGESHSREMHDAVAAAVQAGAEAEPALGEVKAAPVVELQVDAKVETLPLKSEVVVAKAEASAPVIVEEAIPEKMPSFTAEVAAEIVETPETVAAASPIEAAPVTKVQPEPSLETKPIVPPPLERVAKPKPLVEVTENVALPDFADERSFEALPGDPTHKQRLRPDREMTSGPLKVVARSAAGEAMSGDWWLQTETKSEIVLWIGAVQGQGPKAVWLAAVAQAAARGFANHPLSLTESLSKLNHVVCEAGYGQLLMSVFVASIDKSTGVLTYANAGHSPALVVHETKGALKRDDLIPLNEVSNVCLGESVDSIFQESAMQLFSGDQLVFSSSAPSESDETRVPSAKAEVVTGSLIEELAKPTPAETALGSVMNQIEKHRLVSQEEGHVTLVLCRFLSQNEDVRSGAA